MSGTGCKYFTKVRKSRLENIDTKFNERRTELGELEFYRDYAQINCFNIRSGMPMANNIMLFENSKNNT